MQINYDMNTKEKLLLTQIPMCLNQRWEVYLMFSENKTKTQENNLAFSAHGWSNFLSKILFHSIACVAPHI